VLTGTTVDGPGEHGTLWLDDRHVLVRAAVVHQPVQPLLAMATLLFAILASWPTPRPELGDVIELLDDLRRSAAEPQK
jgi:hypothetical protein